MDHFLILAHRRIDSIERAFLDAPGDRDFSPDVQSFLSEIVSQTTLFAAETKLINPRQRDDLLSLSKVAAELRKRMFRPPRLTRRLPCLMKATALSTGSTAKCFTLNISQRGVCLETSVSLRIEQTVTLQKADSAEIVRARVVWLKQTAPSKFIVGLTLLDDRDFWGFGLTPTNPNPVSQGAKS